MQDTIRGTVVKVSGPLVVAAGMGSANMYDVVRVGDRHLVGEIIEMRGDRASIQVYEETAGIGPGDVVESMGEPLCAELGPGLIANIYDGIQRPLEGLFRMYGPNLPKGAVLPGLSRETRWTFVPSLIVGSAVCPGDIIGTVQEGEVIEHRILIPHGVSGKIVSIEQGDYTVDETVCVVRDEQGVDHPVTMMQKWPVRRARPIRTKLPPNVPMITGQRVIDSLFPIAKGGTACIPGPFGSGKTVTQHQLAKWSDVDIVVYVGCGERGNEMTDVLREFPELIDPHTGKSLMKRTVLIANTSDMPVAAREASIYTGITIAEYFRDMGYDVAVIADSTSRWAEALREMSGRLEEMPGEEGYPAYLTSRLAQFYERAGRVYTCGSVDRLGSLSAIGAVSPQGGDLSEPVTQATLRIVKVFWGLEASLAYRRHFPAINWLNSYSLYSDSLARWFSSEIGEVWAENTRRAMKLLQKESELDEIVKLVGIDSLSQQDRMLMEVARSLREDFLQQDSFSDVDSYCPLQKQNRMLSLILSFYDRALRAISDGIKVDEIISLPAVEKIGRAKSVSAETAEAEYAAVLKELDDSLDAILRAREEEEQ